jgi:uncharacterized membrane protein YdjX (TVP38/TMEM64 family)
MRKDKLWGWITALLTILSVLILLFVIPANEKELTKFTIQHPLLAPLLIILFRAIAIIIPPIPGGILSFALIPILGWFWSYLYAVIGVTIGATVAFFIARKFREPIVARFVPLKQLHLWEKKVSHKTEFVAFLVLRLTTGPIMDFISYLAGLTKISFKKFLLITLIAELPSSLAYYLGGKVYQRITEQNSSYFGLGFLLILGILYFFFKDHELITGKKNEKKN